jgi:hypothetical protein
MTFLVPGDRNARPPAAVRWALVGAMRWLGQMHSADSYRKLAKDARAQIALKRSNEVRHALEQLAVAYERHADAMEGKKGS